jgi:hypothetical protein
MRETQPMNLFVRVADGEIQSELRSGAGNAQGFFCWHLENVMPHVSMGCTGSSAQIIPVATPAPCPVTTGTSGTQYDCIHRSGADWKIFSKDLKRISKSLLNDPNCDSFLDSKVGASSLIADLRKITSLFSLANSIGNGFQATTFDVPQATPIIVNASTFFIDTVADNSLTILHELGHFFGVIAPGDTSALANQANDALIMQNCAKTLGVGVGN